MKRMLFSKPWLNVIIISCITIFFAIQIPHLTIDNNTFNFIPDDDKALTELEDFMDQYGSNIVMSLVITNPYGSVLEQQSLQSIKTLTERMEKMEGVVSVESISNTDFISGADGDLVVTPLSLDSSDKLLKSTEIKKRINSWSLYSKLLLSEDNHSTQVGISMDEDSSVEEREVIYQNILSLSEELLPKSYSFDLAGLPATTIQISKNMSKDLSRLIPFVLLLVLIILLISFKKLSGVLLPILNVCVSTIWTLGLMSLTKVPMTILSSVIPVLMIAVGSAYGIHLINHYYDEIRNNHPNTKEERRKIVFHTLKVTGVPIAMAGLTTMAGFGSLIISLVIPMRNFGIFTAFGVASALVVALTLIPSLLIILPVKASKKQYLRGQESSPLLNFLTDLATKKRRRVLLISVILIAGSAFFIPRIIVDNNLVSYFKENTPIRKADKTIREKFAGTNSFNIVISGENPGDLNNPEILLFMEHYKIWMEENYSEISKVMSYSEFVKRINQVLHEDEPGQFSLASTDSKPFTNEGFSQDEFDQEGFNQNGFDDSDSFFSDDFSEETDFLDDSEFETETNPTIAVATTASTTNNLSQITDSLWEAYLSNPDNFMVEWAKFTNHKGLNYYEIPSDPVKYNLETKNDLSNMISQFLLLYSGNLDKWSDEALEPSEARISVQLNKNGSRAADKIIPGLQSYADANLPEGYSVSFCGTALVQSSLTHLIVKSAIMSIILSIILVFIILTLTYKSPVAGLIGIIPLSVTVLINFGVMGLAGIALDISTAMVGSIAIGIGIDYTIHFLSGYVHNYKEGRSSSEITSLTMNSTGKAILFNAVSVAAGFAVLIFSQFNPLMYLGALIVLTMGVSSLAALTLLPVVLNTFKPRFLRKQKKRENLSSIKKNSLTARRQQ